jgi:hypothetical protein
MKFLSFVNTSFDVGVSVFFVPFGKVASIFVIVLVIDEYNIPMTTEEMMENNKKYFGKCGSKFLKEIGIGNDMINKIKKGEKGKKIEIKTKIF